MCGRARSSGARRHITVDDFSYCRHPVYPPADMQTRRSWATIPRAVGHLGAVYSRQRREGLGLVEGQVVRTAGDNVTLSASGARPCAGRRAVQVRASVTSPAHRHDGGGD
jgi:hypothetical protein